MNNQMWAPWRMGWIRGERPEGCIFCHLPTVDDGLDNLVLYRGETCYIVPNLCPYINGHSMVIPYQHSASLTELPPETLTEMMQLASVTAEAARACLKAEGFNIGINMGKAAGAGIGEHLHMHIVPRWSGDNNFLSVTAGVRVISQGLEETYALLREAINSLMGSAQR